jgi:YD repeat-containing protein
MLYDDNGHIAQITEDGGTLIFTHDSAGLLNGMSFVDTSGAVTETMTSVNEYNE